jgi:RNA recognition motif-containing protein
MMHSQVVTDEEGRSRGFGFVHFDSEASAQGCIQDVNGKIIGGQEVRGLRLRVEWKGGRMQALCCCCCCCCCCC